MEIHLHKIAPEYAPDVQRLSEQLGYPLSVTEIENNIKEVMNAEDHTAFIAFHNGKVVGWIHAFKCVFLESNPFIEIGGLVVDEEHRGKGVGKKLIEKIREWSMAKDVHCIRVRSNVKRKEAHQFYLNNGFTEVKEQKVFQADL